MRRPLLLGGAIIIAALLWQPSVEACSRILWSDNGQAVLSARNMEFYTDDLPMLIVFPLGLLATSVIFEEIPGDPRMIYPVTAYEVPPPQGRQR